MSLGIFRCFMKLNSSLSFSMSIWVVYFLLWRTLNLSFLQHNSKVPIWRLTTHDFTNYLFLIGSLIQKGNFLKNLWMLLAWSNALKEKAYREFISCKVPYLFTCSSYNTVYLSTICIFFIIFNIIAVNN